VNQTFVGPAVLVSLRDPRRVKRLPVLHPRRIYRRLARRVEELDPDFRSVAVGKVDDPLQGCYVAIFPDALQRQVRINNLIAGACLYARRLRV
jgi:hypothetical protein